MEEKAIKTGERIAKFMARAGICSRRAAEAMILEGRVQVNGEKLISPAKNVLPGDDIVVDGKKLGEPEATRLWLYHKPVGLVTSHKDEKGRDNVFEHLPAELPRVVSVGRLDLNSEGLLLLTNDGELARRLAHPSTGWIRRYRVRVHGTPKIEDLKKLEKGITIEGVLFRAESVMVERQQGSNCWLAISLREGKNREIRRMFEHFGLPVSRLIRVAFGGFQLGNLPKGEVKEVPRRVLKEQL